jgi:hypothetical protein
VTAIAAAAALTLTAVVPALYGLGAIILIAAPTESPAMAVVRRIFGSSTK